MLAASKFRIPRILIFNVLTITALGVLPYYLFGGKLFVGGDDSRLFYAYPQEFLNHISSSSWFEFSATGSNNPNQFLVPLLFLLSLIKDVVRSPVIVSYLAFSAPLILGFTYFQNTFKELIRDRRVDNAGIRYAGALMYVLSPIMLVNQVANFLYSAWLIALVPIILFCYLRFLKSGGGTYLFSAVAACVLFALALASTPWLLGMLLPLIFGFSFWSFLFRKSEVLVFIRRSALFWGAIVASQSFWLLSFLLSLAGVGTRDYSRQAFSTDIQNSFATTVNATSNGSITYPLLNLFHRQVAFDFNWHLKDVFLNYYDHIAVLNLLFVFILVSGVYAAKTQLAPRESRIYFSLLVALICSLLLFTVNVGPFKQLFLLMGNVPGFAMFRNAFDKFAFGYIFIYCLVISFSLLICARKLRERRNLYLFLQGAFIGLVLINAVPIKQIINHPLWTTESTSTNVLIPAEYTDFMKQVGGKVTVGSSILSMPFGITSYSIIKETGSEGVYAGRSPVQVFSGVNDLSGTMSFSPESGALINKLITDRNYPDLLRFLRTRGVGYVINTDNIPDAVLHSYLFNPAVLTAERSKQFKDAVFGDKLLSSAANNYSLYRLNADQPFTPFTVPNRTFDIVGTDEQKTEQILPLLNERSVITGGTLNAATTSFLTEVVPNTPLSLPAGKYSLYQHNPLINVLGYDTLTQSITLSHNLTYAGTARYGNESVRKLIALPPNGLLQINDRVPYIATDTDGEAVTPTDTVTVYRKSASELSADRFDLATSWSRSDCNAFEASSPSSGLGYAFTATSFRLVANNGHNACIYHSLKIRPGQAIRVSFDYVTTAENLTVIIGDQKKVVALPATTQLQHFSTILNLPTANENALYLYSGMRKEGQAATTYRNLSIDTFNPDETLNLKTLIQSDAIDGIVTSGENPQFLLTAPTHVLDATNYALPSWQRSDCNDLSHKLATSFSPTADNFGMELRANQGHDACIYHDFDVNQNFAYTVNFSFQSHNAKELHFYVSYDNTATETFPLPVNSSGSGSFSHLFKFPVGTKSFRTYLYSGKSISDTAVTAYDKFAVSFVPQHYLENYLVRQADSTIRPPTAITVSKRSDISYAVTIHGASSEFPLNFLQAYHPGWNIYPGTGSGAADGFLFQHPYTATHVEANDFSNLWKIDPERYCRSTDACQQEKDGTYTMRMSVEFTPQKWFYFGSLVTFLTLVACLSLYLAQSLRWLGRDTFEKS